MAHLPRYRGPHEEGGGMGSSGLVCESASSSEDRAHDASRPALAGNRRAVAHGQIAPAYPSGFVTSKEGSEDEESEHGSEWGRDRWRSTPARSGHGLRRPTVPPDHGVP